VLDLLDFFGGTKRAGFYLLPLNHSMLVNKRIEREWPMDARPPKKYEKGFDSNKRRMIEQRAREEEDEEAERESRKDKSEKEKDRRNQLNKLFNELGGLLGVSGQNKSQILANAKEFLRDNNSNRSFRRS